MAEFLAALMTFPTVAYTGLLTVVVLYWCFVLLGALDIDIIHLHGGEGMLEGADCAIHGTHSVLEGADGVLDGADLNAAEVGGAGVSDLLSALNLREAPLTVVVSLIALFGWGLSMTAEITLGFLPVWALVVGDTILSFVGAVLLAGLFARPLGRFFVSQTGRTRAQILGNTALVSTGRVDRDFGQAEATAGNDCLLLQVRCDPGLGVRRGDEVLIVDYDAAAEAYLVEPLQSASAQRVDIRQGAREGSPKEESWEA